MKTGLKRRIHGLLTVLMVLALLPQSQNAYALQYQFNDASWMLSDSNPAVASNWTLTFKTVQVIPVSGTIVITPEATKFTIPAATDVTDIDMTLAAAEIALAATPGTGAGSAWGAVVTVGTSGSITLTNNNTDVVAAGTVVEIEIGTNATSDATGDKQITNPAKTDATLGSADILAVDISSKSGVTVLDTIDLLAAIVEDVDLLGSQKPQMTFTITAGAGPTGGAIAANYIEWKEVAPGTPKTATLRVKVNTDAQNGFFVYVIQDHDMVHSVDAGVDIDVIKNDTTVGTNASPVAWYTPGGTTIGADTGFLGYHTSDAVLGTGTPDRFAAADTWAGLTSTPAEVLYHALATQSNIDGQDYADVTFKLQTNNLQPSGNYSNEITFIAKPIF